MPIDPMTLEVVRNKLINICHEMRIVTTKTAYGSIIFEVVDFQAGLFTADSRMIAETSGLPVFLANMGDSIKATYQDLGEENIEPGDIIFCNDPYAGGSHLTDCTCLNPIFYDNKIVAWSCFRGHMLDVGGRAYGGWFIDTTDLFQEGLILRPVKLFKRGKPDRDIFSILRSNSRLPDYFVGDVRGMVAAIRTGEQRTIELIEKYGLDTFTQVVEEMMAHGEKLAREAVAKIPEGTYTDEVILDGLPLDEKRRVKVTITVKDKEMTMDFTGSSPQSRGPYNASLAATTSLARYVFKALTTPMLPNNEGFFKPLKLIVPHGSMYDPIPPASTSMWCSSLCSIFDLVVKAMGPGIMGKDRAGHYGDVVADFIFGRDPRSGKGFVLAEPTPGGFGALPFADGESGLLAIFDGGDSQNTPMELIEVRYPLMAERYELIQDSGGAGKYRGGLGLVKAYRAVGGDMGATTTAERGIYSPPHGLYGGKPGAFNYIIYRAKDGKEERFTMRQNMLFKEGDVLEMHTGGGGGYGDPLDRDPELVSQDVVDEYVSLKSAHDDYGVVLDPATHRVNPEATRKLREQLRRK